MDTSHIVCPACDGHQWHAKARGRKSCPACHAVVAISDKGIRLLRTLSARQIDTYCPTCKRHAWPTNVRGLRECPSCHAIIMLTIDGTLAVRDALAPKRDYVVVDPASGTLLCVGCSLPTSVYLAVDGRTRGGKRGHICPACQSKHGATPVGTRKPKAGTTWSVIRPLTKNSEEQDNEALFGIAVIEEYRRQDRPIGYGVNLQGANWLHTGDPSWITSAGSQPAHPRDCSCAQHKRTERIRASYYPSVKYGDTLAHYQGMIAGIRTAHVRYVFQPTDGIGRFALSIINTMVGFQRSYVRASARVSDYERTLPRAIPPRHDPPIHRTSYDTLMRHATRVTAFGMTPCRVPPDMWL